jgi:hypothetical protein
VIGAVREAFAARGRSVLVSLRQLGWARVVLTLMGLALALVVTRFSWEIPFIVEAERALFDGRQILMRR